MALRERRVFKKFAREVARDWQIETGKDIKLSHVTLENLANWGTSLSGFNASKSWLMPQEVDLVIEYTQEVAT